MNVVRVRGSESGTYPARNPARYKPSSLDSSIAPSLFPEVSPADHSATLRPPLSLPGEGSGFRVQGAGFRVQGSGLSLHVLISHVKTP